ncbi:Wzz/FepE/Etk N-terminal domain-containing protein [Vibrio alginolyticus]|uniref:Wzz/FepE/Etk N-terminal domain-containing protein n=1 Tax=Vibrio alginolyticus TaxID=663 RepID=UPI003D7E3544
MEPQKEPTPNYLSYPPQPQSKDDEIDLYEIFKALWKGKWIIIATMFVFTVGAVLYALSLPNIYKSDALLAPAETSNGGSLSNMAGQLGGLVALAGVNLGSSESSQTELAVQVMKSRLFAEKFIEKHDLLISLMAVDGWNLEENSLHIDEKIYNKDKDVWLREAKGLRVGKPSLQEASSVFAKEFFNVEQDKKTGLYLVSVRHYSPYVAKQWVDWLIDDINNTMRERAILETSRNLEYLNSQLKKTAVAEMQSTFYKLIEEQTKKLMLAESQSEFIFKTIDPAIVPELKDSPKRMLICLLGLLIGLSLGITLILSRHFYEK